MNRDAVLATIIGFAIGLIITGIFLLGPKLNSMLPSLRLPKINIQSPATKTEETPAASSTGSTGISVDSPLPEAIAESDSLLVSGTAPAGSTVVVQGENDDTVLVVGQDGKYAGKISLKEGKNDITVSGYTKEGTATAQTVSVYYTEEKL